MTCGCLSLLSLGNRRLFFQGDLAEPVKWGASPISTISGSDKSAFGRACRRTTWVRGQVISTAWEPSGKMAGCASD